MATCLIIYPFAFQIVQACERNDIWVVPTETLQEVEQLISLSNQLQRWVRRQAYSATIQLNLPTIYYSLDHFNIGILMP